MKSLFTVLLVCLFVCLSHTVLAGELPTKMVELKNEVDTILFLNNEAMIICVDLDGLINVTAKLQAFAMPSCTESWYLEVPIGAKGHCLPTNIWEDMATGRLYIGNGPLSAVDITNGKIVWALDYDIVGMVHNIIVGKQNLLVFGTKKRGGGISVSFKKDISQGISGHLTDPKLLCVDKATGKVIWEYKYEPDKFLSSQVYFPETSNPASDSSAPFESGLIFLQGKHIYCLDGMDGKQLWVTKEKVDGEVIIHGDCIYAIADEKLVCVNAKDGTPIWKTKKKIKGSFYLQNDLIFVNVDKKPMAYNAKDGKEIWKGKKQIGDYGFFLGVAGQDNLIVLNPGKFKNAVFEGKYGFYGISLAKGETNWYFEKGKDLYIWSLSFQANGNLSFLDKDKYWVIEPQSGMVVVEMKKKAYFNVPSGSGRHLSVNEDGILCYGGDKKNVIWNVEAKLAKRGGSFWKGALNLLIAINAIASSGYVPAYGQKPTTVVYFIPNDPEYAGFSLTDSLIIFPTRDQGILGVSPTDGATIWHVDIKNDPFPYYAPSLNYFVVPMKKELYLVDLSKVLK